MISVKERFEKMKRDLPTREDRDYYVRQHAKFNGDKGRIHSDIRLGKIKSLKDLFLDDAIDAVLNNKEYNKTLADLCLRGMSAHTNYKSFDDFNFQASYDDIMKVFDFMERALKLSVFI